MANNNTHGEILNVPDAPAIKGLVFRRFRGAEDYTAMRKIVIAGNAADQQYRNDTVEDFERSYRHLTNCDPFADMIFAEINGETIGYGRVSWNQMDGGPRVYNQIVFLTPAWRGKGIRRAMLHQCELRSREIAASHSVDAPKVFGAWAADAETDWVGLLKEDGFEAMRFDFEMVRDDLENIPDHPLPKGLAVRELTPEDYQKVWDAAREAFRDHWGFSEEEWSNAELESWMESDDWQPELWQVAWDGNEVAGMVLNFINRKQNQLRGRKRGYTETICVRRPWRRRGLARALIARSLHGHKAQGMTETALGVDTQNPSGALELYQSMGYKITKRSAAYHKPFDTKPPKMREGPNDIHP